MECSDRAVKDFFEDNALNYKHAKKDQQGLYRSSDLSSSIEIFQGDFFDLQKGNLEDVTDIFDRASLVALPEDKRKLYVDKMAELQRPRVRTLLVTLTYDSSEMNGPPFSVTDEEVHDLYSENYSIKKLCFKDVINEETGLRNRGLSSLIETVFKLVRK